MKTNADAISVAGTDAAAILVHTTFSCRVGTRTWVWIDFSCHRLPLSSRINGAPSTWNYDRAVIESDIHAANELRP